MDNKIIVVLYHIYCTILQYSIILLITYENSENYSTHVQTCLFPSLRLQHISKSYCINQYRTVQYLMHVFITD